MSYLFSPDYRFRTWRRLWIALAEAEKELGLPVTDGQIAELRRHADNINYEDAERREREIRHDVMAHIYAYGLQAPTARGIIHLGATSAFVTDNTDILQMSDALALVRGRIVNLMAKLRDFAYRWRATPTLAFTHFQPAQLTTVGKRAALWLHDLLLDYREIEFRITTLSLLGVKGVSIICHGNSTPRAIKNAVKVAVRAVDTRMNQRIEERLTQFAHPVSGRVA